MEQTETRFPWLKIAIAGAALLLLLLMRDQIMPFLSAQAVSEKIAAFGFWAPVAFMLVYIVAPMFLVPAMLLTVVAALIWNWPAAFLYVTLGSNIAANAGFWVGRKLGRNRIEQLTHNRIRGIEDMFVRSGVMGVFAARMLPIAPFHVVNIAAGATRLPWRYFFWGSFLASIPGRLLTIYLVGNFDPRSPGTWLAIAALALLIAVPYKIQEIRNLGRAEYQPEASA